MLPSVGEPSVEIFWRFFGQEFVKRSVEVAARGVQAESQLGKVRKKKGPFSAPK